MVPTGTLLLAVPLGLGHPISHIDTPDPSNRNPEYRDRDHEVAQHQVFPLADPLPHPIGHQHEHLQYN